MLENKYKLNSNYISKYVKFTKTQTLNDDQIAVRLSTYKDSFEKKNKNLNRGFKKNKELSKTSRKKIIESIKWLNLIAKTKRHKTKNGKIIVYKLQMITLTLPYKQSHTDSFITSKCLNNFLTELRNMYAMKNYVWRAEKQKNGNIHYHIVTDSPINWYQTQSIWNRIISKYGYVLKWREKMIKESKKTGIPFADKYPNSTDIKRVPTNFKVENYISKYMAKTYRPKKSTNGKKRYGIKRPVLKSVTCRHYSTSNNLSKLKDFKNNNTDLAEYAYHVAQKLPNVLRKSNDFADYIIVELSRLCGVFKDFKNELLERLKFQIELEPTKILAFTVAPQKLLI